MASFSFFLVLDHWLALNMRFYSSTGLTFALGLSTGLSKLFMDDRVTYGMICILIVREA